MEKKVQIDYTNYRGERSMRTIIPLSITFTQNDWHPQPQWILVAHDCDKDAERSFAIKDIHSWTPL